MESMIIRTGKILLPLLLFTLILSKPASAQDAEWQGLSKTLIELSQGGKFDSAYTLLSSFLEKYPEHAEGLETRMVLVAFTEKDPLLIAKDLEVYARVSNNDQALAQGIVALYIQQYKDEKGMKLVEAVLPKYPKADTLYQLRGQLKVLAEDYKGGIKDLYKALEINPDNQQAILLLTSAHFLDMDVEKAFENVDRLISMKSPLAEKAVSTITNGNDWKLEHLKQALELFNMHFIWEDSEESSLIFIDDEMQEKRMWIEVTPLESHTDAEAWVNSEKEQLLKEDVTSFSYGPFYFDHGCSDEKKCNESYEKMKDFLLNMAERRFKIEK